VLITGGLYRYSRNPIYLGDALILAGLILRWDAVLAVPVLPLFVFLIQRRFILPEEARLAAAFPSAFESFRASTRRWI
jgi:protein-S-isoprenylcysteine O-methyltransferase Ste14